MKNFLTNNNKIASNDCLEQINLKAAAIMKELSIKGKVKKASLRAFITVKDHKKNFPNSLKCRLINAMKSEIGIISKNILDKITRNIRSELI